MALRVRAAQTKTRKCAGLQPLTGQPPPEPWITRTFSAREAMRCAKPARRVSLRAAAQGAMAAARASAQPSRASVGLAAGMAASSDGGGSFAGCDELAKTEARLDSYNFSRKQ